MGMTDNEMQDALRDLLAFRPGRSRSEGGGNGRALGEEVARRRAAPAHGNGAALAQEVARVKRELGGQIASADMHRELNRRVAEALGKPTEGEGSSWHDLPECVARIRQDLDGVTAESGAREVIIEAIVHAIEGKPTLDAAADNSIVRRAARGLEQLRHEIGQLKADLAVRERDLVAVSMERDELREQVEAFKRQVRLVLGPGEARHA